MAPPIELLVTSVRSPFCNVSRSITGQFGNNSRFTYTPLRIEKPHNYSRSHCRQKHFLIPFLSLKFISTQKREPVVANMSSFFRARTDLFYHFVSKKSHIFDDVERASESLAATKKGFFIWYGKKFYWQVNYRGLDGVPNCYFRKCM